jgi:hypothetical protein
VVSRYILHTTLAPPQPPLWGQGMMDSECPAQHHPSPHRGVEGSRSAVVGKVTPPQPRPPASPSGVAGWSSRRARTQQLNSPPLRAPSSRTVPTWASVARGGNLTQQEAPPQLQHLPTLSASTSVMSLWVSERAFPSRIKLDPSATSSPPTRPLPTRRRQRRQNRSKPATCTSSTQTEASTYMSPPRTHPPTSPPTSVHALSPSVLPPAKKTRKRRCELELLREMEDDTNRTLPIST